MENNNFLIRPIESFDHDWLIALWQEEFGDSESFIRFFLEILPKIGIGLIAEYNNNKSAAAYMINDLYITDTFKREKISYIYAVATKSEYRRRGIAGSLCHALKSHAARNGINTIAVAPADEGLFSFYKRSIQADHIYYKNRSQFKIDKQSVLIQQVTRLKVEDYYTMREQMLSRRPHLILTPEALKIEKEICRANGGDLFNVSGSPAAIYLNEDSKTPEIKEIICDESNVLDKIQIIGSYFHSDTVYLNTYGSRNESSIPFLETTEHTLENTHWGILFD